MEDKDLTKREELDLFLERAQEFIDSKYILADIKIVNLLKSIANSKTRDDMTVAVARILYKKGIL